jgi:endogenous inhibitor of DNA gyrase (YacG/DUF329 family)
MKKNVKVKCRNCNRPVVQKQFGRIRYYCDNNDYCKLQTFLRRQEERRLAAQLQAADQ